MSELTRYKLSALYELSSGISSKPEQAGHGYPFCSFSTVFNNAYLPDELPDLMDTSDAERETYSIKAGDVFLTRTSETVDELCMSSVAVKDYPNATYSGFLKRLRPISDKAYPKFMALFFRSRFFRKTVTNKAVMTLRASFNEAVFNDISVDLPPIEEQRRIGDLFYDVECKTRNNNAIISELEAMAKDIYDYWFVQFDFPDANGKPYRSNGGKMVWNEELKREIPEGWKLRHASDLTTVKTGKEDANFATENGQYAYFTCGQEVLRCDVPVFDGHAVLIAGNGDFNVKHFSGKFNAYQRTYVLIPNDAKYYAILYISALETITKFAKGSAGSIVKYIKLGDVNGIRVLDPQNDEMLDFFNLILEKIEQTQFENEQLSSLRDWLLPMLMNGQVKVGGVA